MHRIGTAALTAVALLTGGLITVGCVPAAAEAPTVATTCSAGTPIETDFDGDGRADLVVGGDRWNGTETVRQQSIQPGGGGAATWLVDTGELRPADLNGDVCADAILFKGGHEPWLKVVPGTPSGLDLASAEEIVLPQAADMGDDELRILQFEAAGLRHDGISQVVVSGNHVWENDHYGGYINLFTLDDALGVVNTQTLSFPGFEGDNVDFGSALATSGRTVAVGAPFTKVKGKHAAGAVRIYTVEASNPHKLVKRVVLTQNSPGVPDSAESGDRFGAALAMRDGRLAIGAPGESYGKAYNAGMVQPIKWNEAKKTYVAHRAIHQGTKGVPGKNEKNDRFGANLAIARGLSATGSYDILIGSYETVGKKQVAGSVTVANFTKKLFRTYTLATKGVPGAVKAGDAFSRVGVLRTSAGVDTVLIGAPGKAGSKSKKGAGYAIRSDGKKLRAATKWTVLTVPVGAPSDLTGWGEDFAG